MTIEAIFILLTIMIVVQAVESWLIFYLNKHVLEVTNHYGKAMDHIQMLENWIFAELQNSLLTPASASEKSENEESA